MNETWLRSWKRTPGSGSRGNDRTPGPWHREQEGRGYRGLAWCGSDPGSKTINIERVEIDPLPIPGLHGPIKGKVCANCVRAIKQNSPRPKQRRS